MWYDSHIMLNTTFAAYKTRFKEIMVIIKPLIVVELLILVLSLLGKLYVNERNVPLLLLGILIMLCISFLQIFVYTPAAFKTIQKREIGESITIDEAIAFHKINKWKFFRVTFWIGIYSLGYGLVSALPAMIGIAAGVFVSPYGGMAGISVGVLLSLIGIYFSIRIAYKLYPRIFFALNIYLAKDLEPEAVIQESKEIGTTHANEIWKFIFGLVVINLISFVLVMVVVFPLLYPQYMEAFSNPDATPYIPFEKSAIASFWKSAVGLLFVLPMTYLYMSKAYAKLRAVTEPAIPHAPQAEASVTAEIVQ